MGASSQFNRAVFQSVQARLASLGFRSREEGILALSIAEDALGLVGLNYATSGRGPGVLEINPVIGVKNQSVDQLVAELECRPFDLVSPFSVRTNVGYLSPQSKYLPFLFSNGGPIDGTVDELVEAVRMYGLPFIHSNASLSSLLGTMRGGRFTIPDVVIYRIPVALYIMGSNAEADVYMEEQLVNLGPRTDEAADRFRSFTVRFRELNRSQLPP